MSGGGKVRIALVGAGGAMPVQGLSTGFDSAGSWGWQHARIFATRPDVEFCAIVGRDPAKTQAKAELFGVRPYVDVEEMLEKEKPDLVSLCLPNQEHFSATLEVIRAGVPLLVEKPLVFDLGEAAELLEEAERRGLFFAINFNHRYAKPVELAKAAMESGKIGELTFASWRFGGEGGPGHPHANLIETQCHGFDMLEHLCGPIESVMAEMTDKTGGGYRTLILALKFANGAVGSLIGTYDSSYAYPDTHRVELDGTKGRAVIHDTVRRYTYHPSGSEIGEVWEAGYFNDEGRDFHRTFHRHLDALLGALRSGQEPPIPARAGHRALRLADAAIRSYETGTRIRIE
ncbi:Gfo/Idh/MocA family protein [Cohnella zeiphila]|uniref:Gfo/Idh/MocA family oxidoreductase n=1 Tax=Cohnella zeiphila TaxID=2761120 RepID=A0A7X0SPK3_9BACL|nr:Gfo/Idh/MocA family oxidoreductase [Cohnella zeiphila]MBB6733817.1 Gfo/Idh/MocA family oxidoreductase [Cohnella zeiphila]